MNNCKCCENDEIKITLEDEQDIDINFDNKLNVIVNRNHAELENLDYENSGHIGFMPSKLSLLPDVSNDVSNDRLVIMANVDNVASKITLRQIQDRVIKTSNEVPNDLQIGQYLFLEK